MAIGDEARQRFPFSLLARWGKGAPNLDGHVGSGDGRTSSIAYHPALLVLNDDLGGHAADRPGERNYG